MCYTLRMNLYHIEARIDHPAWKPWYDKAFGFIVVAYDEDSARMAIINSGCAPLYEGPGDEGDDVWRDRRATVCKFLGRYRWPNAVPHVVMRDFHAA